MKIVAVLLAGLTVFIGLKIIGIFLKKGIPRYPILKSVLRILPLIQIIIWFVFVFLASTTLFVDRSFYPYAMAGMLMIATILFVWFVLRDVFAGAIFRVQNDLNIGDYIKIGELSGQIKAIRLTHLEIITDNGQSLKIPNTRLNNSLISGMTTPEGMEEFTISLTLKNSLPTDKIEEKIKYEITNSAWCNYKNPPVIKLQNRNEEFVTFDVLVYTLNQKHLRIVEKMLKEKFGIKKA